MTKKTFPNVPTVLKSKKLIIGLVACGILVLLLGNVLLAQSRFNEAWENIPDSADISKFDFSDDESAESGAGTSVQSSEQGTNQGQSSSAGSSSDKAYANSVCTKTPIAYKTNYISVSYLDVGETSSIRGYDGYVKSCTADSNGYKPSDWTVPASDETVYVGTRATANTSSTPQYTYGEALSIAQNNCARYGNSSAYSPCINAYMHKFGY